MLSDTTRASAPGDGAEGPGSGQAEFGDDYEIRGAYGWQFFLGPCAVGLGGMSGVAAWLALRGLSHH